MKPRVYRQVLKDQETLGEDHPGTRVTRHELARAVGEQGRWSEAEVGFRAVLRAGRCSVTSTATR
jgi:hypothetical protein